jgi:poly-beta-hydroxyalkanoate depolymerase
MLAMGRSAAAGVGHYGVFSGKRWENQVYPIVKNVVLSSD